MKRYQAISIEGGGLLEKHTRLYKVILHDRMGKDGVFTYRYELKMNKKEFIKALRADGIEVSKHVENGGKLRLY